MNKAVPYLVVPLLFAALVLHNAEGLVLCVCDDGKIVIETSCFESGCCTESPSSGGEMHTEDGCRSCTQIPLLSNDTLAQMLPSCFRTDTALCASLVAQLSETAMCDPVWTTPSPSSLDRGAPQAPTLSILRI